MLQTEAGGDGDTGMISLHQTQLCRARWQMGLVASHGGRQITQKVGLPWLAECPMLWGHAHS